MTSNCDDDADYLNNMLLQFQSNIFAEDSGTHNTDSLCILSQQLWTLQADRFKQNGQHQHHQQRQQPHRSNALANMVQRALEAPGSPGFGKGDILDPTPILEMIEPTPMREDQHRQLLPSSSNRLTSFERPMSATTVDAPGSEVSNHRSPFSDNDWGGQDHQNLTATTAAIAGGMDSHSTTRITGAPITNISNLPQESGPVVNTAGGATTNRINGYPSTPQLAVDVHVCAPPHGWDVVCSRGRRFYKLPGCVRFRRLVEAFQTDYRKAETRFDKSMVIDALIGRVMELEGVRFLKFLKSTSTFELMDADSIRDKVGHALRDAARDK